MKNRTITTMLVAVFATLILSDAASAYYSPRMGRFLNRDPIDEPGAILLKTTRRSSRFIPRDSPSGNTYTAMWNNAIKWFDPDGREAQTQPSQGTYVPCKVCCERKVYLYQANVDLNGSGTLTREETVDVPEGKTKAEACREKGGLLEQVRFLHSGPCDNPCDGKPKVPLWICGRPIDITGLGWGYYVGLWEHGYICCDGPNNNCRNFWETTSGRTQVSTEAICTGKCVKINVCPEEKAEKCQGQNWRQSYSCTGYNCNSWKRDFGNTRCP